MNIEIINPIEYPDWHNLLLANPFSTFFHSSAWAKVLCESYNYKPLYFAVIENGKLSSLIPVMEVKSFLTGKRGVSLPFTDECHPILHDQKSSYELMKHVIDYGKNAAWKHIEFRGGNDTFYSSIDCNFHYNHELTLGQDEEKIFSSFKSNVKRNIKRAQKQSVYVTLSHTMESVNDFYRLNCMTRKNHGLPPQPFTFFRKVFDHIISQQKGFVALALYKMKPIAGAIYFHHKRSAIYKYGASDGRYLNLRPNNLVMWETIRWYCRKGFNKFSFGRTEPENLGLLQFKRAWGTKEKKLNYYKYDLKKDSFVSLESGLKTSYSIFRHMPTSVLRLTGNIIYRHVG